MSFERMSLEIGGRPIGSAHPVFVVAEIGLNHGGSLAKGLAMVDAAAGAGASAIKLQTLDAAQLVSNRCSAPAHIAATSMREFFRTFELDVDAVGAIVARARALGLAVLSTPLCLAAVDALEPFALDAYKIASGDLTYHALIAAAARTRRPLVLSTGMSSLDEVAQALAVARQANAEQLALLHCVSAYPTPADDQNLRAVITLRSAFNLPVGLSDHHRDGLVSAVAAAALGACIYERHLVLDGDDQAVDRAVSSTPAELKAIVGALSGVQGGLGDGIKRCRPAERPNLEPSRRGLYATRRLAAGERLTVADVAVLRPAAALQPADLHWIIGTTLSRDIESGMAFESTHVTALESIAS